MRQDILCRTPTRLSILAAQVGAAFTDLDQVKLVRLYLMFYLGGFIVFMGTGAVMAFQGEPGVLYGSVIWLVVGLVGLFGIFGAWYLKDLYSSLGERVKINRLKAAAAMLLYLHDKKGDAAVRLRVINSELALLVKHDRKIISRSVVFTGPDIPWLSSSTLQNATLKGEKEGLFKRTIKDDQSWYSLTGNGMRMAGACWHRAPPEEREELERCAGFASDMTADQFLSYFGAMLRDVVFGRGERERFERVRAAAAVSMVRSGKITEKEGVEISGLVDRGFADLLADGNAGDDPGPVDSRRHSD